MVDLLHATDAAAVIREHALATPERTAVILVDDMERDDGATHWTYAQLDGEARRIAAWLQSRYPVGTRVLLLHPAGFGFAAAYVGCLYAGAVAVPAPLPGHYRHEHSRVTRIARNAAVSVALTDTANLPGVREWVENEGLTGTRVLATDDNCLPDAGSWTPQALNHTTVAMLQYTSGSTGDPKGVVVRHGNLLHNVDGQRRAFGLTDRDRLGGWIPHYHDMGLLGQLLPALMLGGTCVLMRAGAFLKRPDHWLLMIDKYDVSMSAAPNFAYELCCAKVTDEQLAGLDLSRWRIACNGSEPIDAAVLDAFAKRFAPAGLRDDAPCPCYGMAEATVFVSAAPYRKPLVTTVDVGQLAQRRFVPTKAGAELVACGTPRDYDVVIANPWTGEALPPGGVGEIWLRGPSIAREYWRDDTETDRVFTPEGYLRTGDLGALHDGELYVTGRCEEAVTVAGRHLYPQDLERKLRARHPELAGVGAVFTAPLGKPGDERTVVVTHEVGGRPSEPALRRLATAIRRTLAEELGVPDARVVLLRRGTVRRTTSGKIQRVAMRRSYLDGSLNTLHADHEPPPKDEAA